MPSDKESVTVLQFPPISHSLDEPVTVLELGPGTGTCPENFFVVHLITKGSKGASSDLKYVIESLFESGEKHSAKDSSKPRVLWSFTWDFILNSPLKPYCSKNVKICSDIDFKLDYDLSILEVNNF